ncbi:hypothetical protein Tco_0426284 [Tanacetum coccineum]
MNPGRNDLPAGSIHHLEGSLYSFLAQFLPTGRTAKLRNDILMFQQHHGESLSELRDRNSEESWALLEDPTLYDNESWNDPREFVSSKALSLLQDVLSTLPTRLNRAKDHVLCLMKVHLVDTPTQSEQNQYSCKICNGTTTLNYCMEDSPEQALYEYGSLRNEKAEKKDPETLLLVGRGIPRNAMQLLDHWMSNIVVGEIIISLVFCVKGEGMRFGDEDSTYWTTRLYVKMRKSYKPCPSSDGVGTQIPYYARKDFLNKRTRAESCKDVLMFRRMVEFLGAIPIKLKSNMWESEDLI